MPTPRPIVILGPTAGGKSELAVALAESFEPHGEIINADSMQVYRHMDAGTAKPPRKLRERVVHHLIDVVEPTERFTVADWLERAEPLIEQMQSRGVRPVIVGGTNLYLKALLEGMFEGPEGDPALRAELTKFPGMELHAKLAAIDPAAAHRIHPNDTKKLVRAIEVFTLTGKPISDWQEQWSDETRTDATYRHNPILIGLDWPVEAINQRINARVKEMFHPVPAGRDLASESLPDEVHRLEAIGILGPQAREALGYKQLLDHLRGRGECTLDEAFEKTKILTRRFAKTQRTWLRRYRGVTWLPAASIPPETLAAQALAAVLAAEKNGPNS